MKISRSDKTDLLDAAAMRGKRFWVPRGSSPDLSDDGFLVDPESPRSCYASVPAFPFERLAELPVVGLLGEPGMGKTTVLDQEFLKTKATGEESGDLVLKVDLAACGSDSLVCQSIFRSESFRAWKATAAKLQLFLDGFDTCLQHVETLVALLLTRLAEEPCERLTLRIASRTAEWPPDLETGLKKLWRAEDVGIFDLAPLRRGEVRAAATAVGVPADEFLAEVGRLGASQLANRPITLRFLLNSYSAGKGLPARRTDLYRGGCLALCDEWRPDLRRSRLGSRLSSGTRFAVASRLAAITVFGHRTAIWQAPRHEVMPEGDVRGDELCGGNERFESEVIDIRPSVVRETIDTGLFRSIGPHRVGFSHQTYAEYLAAQYLVDHGFEATKILAMVRHPDSSGRLVPQLRETAAWLADLVPNVRSAILTTDPAALLASNTPLAAEEDRRTLVRQILQLFDTGALVDVRILAPTEQHYQGDRLKYAGIARDLKPYIIDKSKRSTARRAAIFMTQSTQQADLERDLLRVALDDKDALDVRIAAVVAVRTVGSEETKAGLRPLLTLTPEHDPRDELKGGGLTAVWPKHLSADELFAVLVSPRQPNFIGIYQQFLASDWQAHLTPTDMVSALQWAHQFTPKKKADSSPIANAALRVVIAAIDSFSDARVCTSVAEILSAIAVAQIPILELMSKLSSHRAARNAIARAAIRHSEGDLYAAECFRRYGLVQEGDVPFLLGELKEELPASEQQAIALLIANLLYGVPWFETELIDQVFNKAKSSPILAAAMKHVIEPVALDSDDAAEQRSRYRARDRRAEPTPVAKASNPEDLIDAAAAEHSERATAFIYYCYAVAGANWDPTEGTLPGWEGLSEHAQREIMRSAEDLLKRCCPVDTSWTDSGVTWYFVTCGYWALRLLLQTAPGVLNSFSDDVWYAWMPSLFGEQPAVADEVHETLLRTARARSPARFLDLLNHFIDAQDRRGEISVLDALPAVWDNAIAELLHSKLKDTQLDPRACGHILNTLLKAGDVAAAEAAGLFIAGANHNATGVDARAMEAARVLLKHNPSAGWKIVWPVFRTNHVMAEILIGCYGHDPYSSDTTHLMQGLDEAGLAELIIWLFEHHVSRDGGLDVDFERKSAGPFELITTDEKWKWLRIVAFDSLIQRGTPAAAKAIRKIKARFPRENIELVEKVAEDLTREKSWKPFSPSEFLASVLDTGQQGAPAESGKAHKPPRRNTKYKAIDEALREIAQARPMNHEEVFRSLEGRKIKIPNREPFKSAMGWMKGFERNKHSARAWLSQVWRQLGLDPFSRGPKKVVIVTTPRPQIGISVSERPA